MLVPSGMAYAILAGLPPVYGLYGATIPTYIYSLLGTSHEISMGPQAIISLLLGTSAVSLGYPVGSKDFIPAIMNLSMICGLILYFLGACRLGVLANFLSYSVLVGFTTASASLLVLIFGSIIAYGIISGGLTLQVVGKVPAGLLTPNFAFFTFDDVIAMFPSAFIISIILFSTNWAVAKRFAVMRDYQVNATQELMAAGLMNILGPLFHCAISGGGFARTAVNYGSGAKTQMSGAIIEVNVASLMDFKEMINSYRVDKHDCVVMWVTFLSTFFIGIPEGIFLGVVMSIAFVMNSSAFPLISHLGKLPDEDGGYFADIKRFPNAVQIPHVAIIRMDTTLYFANIQYFKEKVVEASKAWNDVDLSGINMLQDIHHEFILKSIQLAFVCSKGRLRDRLETAHFIEKLGEQYIYMTIEDAIRALPNRRASIARERKFSMDVTNSPVNIDIETKANAIEVLNNDYTYNVILQEFISEKTNRSSRSSSVLR
eukprot:gene17720-23312_t